MCPAEAMAGSGCAQSLPLSWRSTFSAECVSGVSPMLFDPTSSQSTLNTVTAPMRMMWDRGWPSGELAGKRPMCLTSHDCTDSDSLEADNLAEESQQPKRARRTFAVREASTATGDGHTSAATANNSTTRQALNSFLLACQGVCAWKDDS